MNTICVVTGTRAEYGLLSPLLAQLSAHPQLNLQLVVTGMHLIAEYGHTINDIINDGYPIAATVDCLLASNSPSAVAKSVGIGVMGFTDALSRLNPDLVILLGDRFEILAAAQAALLTCIPIAHIHGGERSEGVLDDSIRHAITKMAYWHFTTTEEYRQRVIQMGESPQRVFNVGALSVENVLNVPRQSRSELSTHLGYHWRDNNFLLTLHPETLGQHPASASNADTHRAVTTLLKALDAFPEVGMIITGANADAHGQCINQAMRAYAIRHTERILFTPSLGLARYLSAAAHVDVVIGNSSSGLIEVPILNQPSVNIGERQRGRVCPDSVICCATNTQHIIDAIQYAMCVEHREHIKQMNLPYGKGDTAKQIISIITRTPISSTLTKDFFDLPLTIDP